MQKLLYILLRLAVRLLVKPSLSPRVPVALSRGWGWVMGLTLLGPRGAHYRRVHVAGVPCMEIVPHAAEPGWCVLYLHGGAYVIGGYATHRKLAAAIGDAVPARTWMVDYRLAPEHPYPAALDDALAVYRNLVHSVSAAPRIAIAGDSAGGGLALALTATIRQAGLPAPCALVLLSPWVDLTLSGETMATQAARDPMVSAGWLRWAAALYCGARPPETPGCSPLFEDFTGFPPMLIQVGTDEVLAADATRLNERALRAGVDCRLQRVPGAWHDIQLHYRVLDQATRAVADAGRFIAGRASAH